VCVRDDLLSQKSFADCAKARGFCSRLQSPPRAAFRIFFCSQQQATTTPHHHNAPTQTEHKQSMQHHHHHHHHHHNQASPKLVMEEAPESYKDVTEVVNTCHAAGISNKCVKLRPIAVVKG
jgi:hypothetical protein